MAIPDCRFYNLTIEYSTNHNHVSNKIKMKRIIGGKNQKSGLDILKIIAPKIKWWTNYYNYTGKKDNIVFFTICCLYWQSYLVEKKKKKIYEKHPWQWVWKACIWKKVLQQNFHTNDICNFLIVLYYICWFFQYH